MTRPKREYAVVSADSAAAGFGGPVGSEQAAN